MADCAKIENNIISIRQNLKSECELIVVSKFRRVDEIQCAYNTGHRAFAENRVQALLERKDQLPEDIEWHLIGHLQRNKVKYIAPFISLIHSVDSFRLLKEINAQAQKHQRTIPCLIQVHVAEEESKFGLLPDDAFNFFKNERWKELKHIRIEGLMAMATLTQDERKIEKEYDSVAHIFDSIKGLYSQELPYFKKLSIGMSGDYKIAQKYGSTMVRIGSAVFI